MQEGDALPTIEKHVTQERIEQYANASGDFNPVHLDKEFASGTQFGGTIAHGMLILAFISEMLTEAFRENWSTSGRLKIRFRNPVRPGETVHTFGQVKKVRNSDGTQVVTCSVGVRNADGEVAISGDATVDIASV